MHAGLHIFQHLHSTKPSPYPASQINAHSAFQFNEIFPFLSVATECTFSIRIQRNLPLDKHRKCVQDEHLPAFKFNESIPLSSIANACKLAHLPAFAFNKTFPLHRKCVHACTSSSICIQ